MQNEETIRHKAPQRYSQPEDDEDLEDEPYDDRMHQSHLKEDILYAISHNELRESFGNLTHGISKELDDEKRLIDERLTRQIIEDSYKLPTEHIMKYSTLDHRAKDVILDDLTNYYDEENRELVEILDEQKKYKTDLETKIMEEDTNELDNNHRNVYFYEKEGKLLDERIGIMQNRIRHLAQNNEHIKRKTEYMDEKKNEYLIRRKEKLERERILEEHRIKKQEDVRRRHIENAAFFGPSSKDKRDDRNQEIQKVRKDVKAEKNLIQNLTSKQYEFNKQKNEQKILMAKIDRTAKMTKKAELGREKYTRKKEESRAALIDTQKKNEELRLMLENLEKQEKGHLEALNKTLVNQNKSYQTLNDIKNKKLSLGDVEGLLMSKIVEHKIEEKNKTKGPDRNRKVSTSATKRKLMNKTNTNLYP